MNAFKKALTVALVAAVTTLAGCSSIKASIERSQALFEADPAAYSYPGSTAALMEVDPQYPNYGG